MLGGVERDGSRRAVIVQRVEIRNVGQGHGLAHQESVMGGAKPWQIAVIVLGIGVLLFMITRTLLSKDETNLINEMTLVDVETGDLFSVYRADNMSVMTPARNPDTGKLTLFIVFKEGETWKVPAPFNQMLKKDMKAVQDPYSGLVTAKDQKPKRVELKDLLIVEGN